MVDDRQKALEQQRVGADHGEERCETVVARDGRRLACVDGLVAVEADGRKLPHSQQRPQEDASREQPPLQRDSGGLRDVSSRRGGPPGIGALTGFDVTAPIRRRGWRRGQGRGHRRGDVRPHHGIGGGRLRSGLPDQPVGQQEAAQRHQAERGQVGQRVEDAEHRGEHPHERDPQDEGRVAHRHERHVSPKTRGRRGSRARRPRSRHPRSSTWTRPGSTGSRPRRSSSGTAR